ncbi:MAG: pyruvate kinase [Pseudanabaenaceae cyanobacterium]
MFPHRTKIVATIGPASNSRPVLEQLIRNGLAVARLNFSHGSYEDHAQTVSLIRHLAEELDQPVSLLQDLQGPKVRVGKFPNGSIHLQAGETYYLVPLDSYQEQPHTIPIDYPYLAEEATVDARVLLDDGLLELKVKGIQGQTVTCTVVKGGELKNRKGVNLPSFNLRLPALTDKDKQDLAFGVEQKVDWVSLSFVRQAQDILELRQLLHDLSAPHIPIVAKIEKPQAIANLDSILDQCDGVMVARGDLGVEMNPEQVPLLQKEIIRKCNQRALPVITATQMLESMIHNPRPTRAEASDVANAIIDGTDAVMLSGESAVGEYPVESLQMLAKIAMTVEPTLNPPNYPPFQVDNLHAISEALNTIDKILNLKYIIALTNSGLTARLASAERPHAPILAITPNRLTYQRLNLLWGVTPLYLPFPAGSISLETFIGEIEKFLRHRRLVQSGDLLLILGSSPVQSSTGTNFLKLHTVFG